MSTIGDTYERFMSSYIRKTKEPEPLKKIEDSVLPPLGNYSENFEKFSFTINGKTITPIQRRLMALTAPFYMKGVRKKSRDTFRAGWCYKKVSDGTAPPKIEQQILDDFNKRNNIEYFMGLMKQDAHIYGDGLCLILFINDQNKKSPDLSREPSIDAEPYTLKRLDPEKFTQFQYKNEGWKKKRVEHLLYEDKGTGNKIFIHPDRVVQFKETDFAFTKFGISDIDMLRHVISSQADIDIATGELLKWFSYGIIEWTKDGAGANAMKTMRQIAEKHPHIYIGNEKYKLNIHNPEAIDPEPFYNYLIMSIAAILVMPTHVLKGVEVGDTTGAESGYADYNKDIRDSQVLVYKPGLEYIYSWLFRAKFDNRTFDYVVDFNPMYVGEMAEAEVDAKRSASAVNLYTAKITDLEESRRIINEGHICLDPQKEIDQGEEQKAVEPIKQNPRTMQSVPKKEKEDVSKDNKLKAIDDTLLDISLDDIGKFQDLAQEKRVAMAQRKQMIDLRKRIGEIKNE